MATKKAKKSKKKPTLDDGGDTPITIGGGGGTPKIPFALKITLDPNAWTENPPGTFTLSGGNIKRFKVTAVNEGLNADFPVSGDVRIVVTCKKPKTAPR